MISTREIEIKHFVLKNISDDDIVQLEDHSVSIDLVKSIIGFYKSDVSCRFPFCSYLNMNLNEFATVNGFDDLNFAWLNFRLYFQLNAVLHGCLSANCPYTGVHLESNTSLILNPNLIYYKFFSERVSKTFYLIQSRIAKGFPIEGIYLPDDSILITLENYSRWSINEDNLQEFLFECRKEGFQSYSNNQFRKGTALVVGHNHFAHHLWNELTGVQKLIDEGLIDNIDRFYVINQPLGDLKSLFPEIDENKLEYLDSDIDVVRVLKNNYFTIRVGGYFIKEKLTQRIKRFARQNICTSKLDLIQQVRNKHKVLVWISLRAKNRTLINQSSFFIRLIKELSKDKSKTGIIIDGFSLPFRLCKQIEDNFLNAVQNSIISKEQQIIEEISNELPEEIKVYNLVGTSLHESVLWADIIDCYFCHHGTIQHKIAWFASKPGIIHSNRKVLKVKPSQSYQVKEGALKPIYIDRAWVEDIEISEAKKEIEFTGNYGNYKFIKEDSVIQKVITLLEEIFNNKQ